MKRKEAARRGEKIAKRSGTCSGTADHTELVGKSALFSLQVAFLRPERSKRRLYFFRSDDWARIFFAAPAYTSSAK
jgi:hypothetical protein